MRLNKQNTYILLPYRDSRRGPSASFCGTAFCRPTLKAGTLSLAETPQWWSEILGHAEDIHGGSTAQRDIKLLKISFENLFFNFIFLNIKENKIFGFHSLFPAIQDTAPFSKTPQCGVASTSLHFSGVTPLSAMLRDPAPRGTKSEPAWQRGLWDVQTDGKSVPPRSGESENRRKVRLSRSKVNIKRYREFIEDDLFNIKLFFKYRSPIVLNFLGSDVDGITPLLS